ncbi:MAG: hypothetical protein HQ502_05615 [Alphaproteobacteria bacterium]|nr:hypothetical protein [Alphaproteobacteria bacterium]
MTVALLPLGLIPRGGFHPLAKDGVPARRDGGAVATVVLVGNAGPDLWQRFKDHAAGVHALDEWCRAALTPLAQNLDADILFPFDGPPHSPFLRWAQRAEGLAPSPIGPSIHPEYGLWHAYRGALLFGHEMTLPPPLSIHPCDDCTDRPCLTACPVAAFGAGIYDVPACASHLRQAAGRDCMDLGCRARRACPIGRNYHYQSAQARFHMTAFLRNY